jgi:hypothetical protein
VDATQCVPEFEEETPMNTIGKGILGAIITLGAGAVSVLLNGVFRANRMLLSINTAGWKLVDSKFSLASTVVIVAALVSALIYLLSYYVPTMNKINGGGASQRDLRFPVGNFIASAVVGVVVVAIDCAIVPQAILMHVVSMVCIVVGTLITYAACKCK